MGIMPQLISRMARSNFERKQFKKKLKREKEPTYTLSQIKTALSSLEDWVRKDVLDKLEGM